MRTTITLDPDVAAAIEHLRDERNVGISQVVNELVRRGLAQEPPPARFNQRTSAMGVPALLLDDIAGVLDALEGDAHH